MNVTSPGEGYHPLANAPDLEEGASEPDSPRALEKYITSLEKEETKWLSASFRPSSGKIGINQKHPYVTRLNRAAKNVDALYAELEKTRLTSENLEQFQSIEGLRDRVHKLQFNLEQNHINVQAEHRKQQDCCTDACKFRCCAGSIMLGIIGGLITFEIWLLNPDAFS